MSVSDNDNMQDRTLAEHTIQIRMLEANVATLGQAVVALTETTTKTGVHVEALVEATKNNLESMKAQGEALTRVTNDTAWIKRIGYAFIGAVVAVVGWYLKSAIGG
jgi:hypothetical protein